MLRWIHSWSAQIAYCSIIQMISGIVDQRTFRVFPTSILQHETLFGFLCVLSEFDRPNFGYSKPDPYADDHRTRNKLRSL